MVLEVVMEISAILLTCYCHLLSASWVPDTSLRSFKPHPKTILSSPGLPQPPEKAASSELGPQLKGLYKPGGTSSLSTAHVKSGGQEQIPGVLSGGSPCHLSVLNSGMPEKPEHLHYSTHKLISKTVHLNIHQASESQFWLQALLLLTLQLRPETQEHDSDLPKAVLPLSTTAASTGILISTLSILSI